MPWSEVFKQILNIQGGVHPALFLLCVLALSFVIWKLWQAYQASEDARRKESAQWSAARDGQFEKRIEEGTATRVALEHTSVGLATLVTSVEARTQPITDMVHGLAMLVAAQEASRGHFKDQADRIERHLETLKSNVTDIKNSRGSQ